MSEPEGLVEVAKSGDRRRTLEELRDLLALTIATAEPSNRAQLANQLRLTMTELEGLADGVEVDAVDELAARRPDSAPVPKRAGRKR